MRLVAVDGILRKGALAPGVGAAHAMDVLVNIKIDETSALDVIGMMSAFKIFLAVVPSTDAEGLESLNP